MTELNAEIVRLSIYETKPIVVLRTLPPGVYTQKMLTQGNSLLSTVFVESLDVGASVAVRYYDFTQGYEQGEQYELAAHPTITTAMDVSRITVPRLHDKPIVELTIAGGSVRVGIYVTVVASFVTDLDQALQLDASTVDLQVDKGMPAMLYDEIQNKFFFLRGEGGTIPVSISESGTPQIISSGVIAVTPGVAQDLITSVVPVTKTRKLNKVNLICRHHGFFHVLADSVIIGSGRTGPAQPNAEFRWEPRSSHVAGTTLIVRFTSLVGVPAGDCEAYLMGSDL